MKKNKLFVLINTIGIFAFSFITHNLYTWFPSFITSIFPVNESLYEHMKLIFITPVIFSTILYFIFYFKKHKINNFLLGLLSSSIFNIIVFYIVYLPIYKLIGENMIFTFIWYFISIGLSQIVNYFIINKKNNSLLNIISLVLIIFDITVMTYFTYHPIITEFFRDPKENYYGIKNY